MIKVVVRIVPAGIVPDPLAVRMDVRRIRMPILIRKRTIFFDRVSGPLHGSGTMRGRARGGTFMTTRMSLRKNRNNATRRPMTFLIPTSERK
jgi:hypothetical protein